MYRWNDREIDREIERLKERERLEGRLGRFGKEERVSSAHTNPRRSSLLEEKGGGEERDGVKEVCERLRVGVR